MCQSTEQFKDLLAPRLALHKIERMLPKDRLQRTRTNTMHPKGRLRRMLGAREQPER